MCLDLEAVTILHPRFENLEARNNHVRPDGRSIPPSESAQRRTAECTGPYQVGLHEQNQVRGDQLANRG